jgi:ABC-2 type transport system permease protein
MREIAAMAFKDLRILLRDRMGFFFTLIWPMLIAVFFGMIFGGNRAEEQATGIHLVVVDRDRSPQSEAFIRSLESGGEFRLTFGDSTQAAEAVMHRRAVAYIILQPGFGEASDRVFWGEPARVELGVDPARNAEAAMVEGVLMKHASERLGDFFSNRRSQRENIRRARQATDTDEQIPPEIRRNLSRLFADLDRFVAADSAYADTAASAGMGRTGFQPIAVERRAISAPTRRGPRSAFAITFPQGVIWGLIGTSAGFAVSIVTERTRGTLFRLQTAPIGRTSVLGGKALACFISILLMAAALYTLAFLAFGLRPASLPLLVLAVFSGAAAFVGIMMLLAVSGKTEQAVGGIGWAVMIVISMVGGGMIPLFFMPHWLRSIGTFSPAKWSILAMEGAVWRGFSLTDMLKPCGILIAIGVVCFAVGVRVFDWSSRTE